MPAEVPRVGVAAIIRRTNTAGSSELLVGRRLSSHGKGTWQFPGGHLEYGEEYFDCAVRETLEETGLKVKAVKLARVANSVFVEDRKHYITLFVACDMLEDGAVPEVSLLRLSRIHDCRKEQVTWCGEGRRGTHLRGLFRC